MTLRQQVEALFVAIDQAKPSEMRELAKDLMDRSKSPASLIAMRPTFRAMAKLLREASQL